MNILELLLNEAKQCVDFSQIEYTNGERHIAASIDGYIGICATLGTPCPSNATNFINPNCYAGRIALNAAVNACLNYKQAMSGTGDIFDAVDFSRYKCISMIGYFNSLVDKFRAGNIALNIFDMDRNDVPTLPMEQQAHHLKQSDCVVVTATTISNGTFDNIIAKTSLNAHVFILGPSTPLSTLMFGIPQIKGLFGAHFKRNDTTIADSILSGEPYSAFKLKGQKVFMLNL